MPNITITPRRSPSSLMLNALGALAGIITVGLVTAACYEQYRHQQLVRALSTSPSAGNILPLLNNHSRMVLAAFGLPAIAPTSEH